MASDELKEIGCELAESETPEGHPLWAVFAALFRLEVGDEPAPVDLYKLGCCPRHF
ncbi:hypothetical protein ABZ502_15910 [Streptomyces abikoensis]|uniref:Uncharacterized protein n=1 Tax=Streptomyces triculaminicus TaxID=2816232 RepID=A0A939FQY4_9ACTN|nr:hypothetical protein [Streptomyces triculaminicus]MBO0656525.1 hypothetical protein [Streptomyces triculaminicus]